MHQYIISNWRWQHDWSEAARDIGAVWDIPVSIVNDSGWFRRELMVSFQDSPRTENACKMFEHWLRTDKVWFYKQHRGATYDSIHS